jgi:uncharacterized protein DUF1579
MMNMPKPLAELCVAVAVAVLGTSASSTSRAQEGGPPVSKPTAEHKILASEEGTWDASVKTFMSGPDAEPMVSKGVEVNTMMPGGLWMLSKFQGEFGGMPFEGRGQFGYDPLKKKYVGTWIDSTSTILSVLEGEYDAKTKTMTYVGDGYDPGQKAKFTQKMVTTTKGDGTRVFTLYMKYAGQPAEAKFMEITYTKKK